MKSKPGDFADTEAETKEQAENRRIGRATERAFVRVGKLGRDVDQPLGSRQIEVERNAILTLQSTMGDDRRVADDVVFNHPLEQATDHAHQVVEASGARPWPAYQESLDDGWCDLGKIVDADLIQVSVEQSKCLLLNVVSPVQRPLKRDAPIRGLGSQTTVGTIVGTAIRRAGVQTRYRGSHQFRHALAADMLRNGSTLTEIGSLLRHRHPKTTGIYAKVDFEALRPLSQRWPGDAQ